MKNIVYLSLLVFSLKTSAQPLIFPYSDGHRWGLTNSRLEIIAKPQFDTTVFFEKEPYGIAIKDKRYGTIGRDGKKLIDFTYDYISDYGDGFGQGYTGYNGYTKEGYRVTKFVLLNLKTGKQVSQNSYDQLWHYCHCPEKIFSVRKDTQTIFVSGITGKQLGKASFQDIAVFLPEERQGNTTKAIVKTNGKYGVFDAKKGNWIVPAKYDEISQTFHQDKLAIEVISNGVKTNLDFNGKPFPDKNPNAGGREEAGIGIIEVEGQDRDWETKDLYVYNQGDGNWKLGIETRRSGSTKVHETFELKGYSEVEKIMYYDELNKIPAVIKAVKGGKAGIIGFKGEVLVPFIYDKIESLKIHSHYLQTTLNNKTGVLRRDLTVLCKPVLKMVLAEEYRLNSWFVEMPNGYRGYMDSETGKIYIPGVE